MLQVHNLHKSYGITTVLAGINLIVNDGEHVGLIGPNGAGKSTLLRCIIAQEQPDSGTVTLSPTSALLGYVPQSFGELLGDRSIAEVVAEAQAEYVAAEAALAHTADALADAADMAAALTAYDAALAHFEALGGYEREHRSAAVLQGLGLGTLTQSTPASTLSGGQKTRLGLATLLLREPDLLLLDEPTNHLDVEALEWLEGFVRGYGGAVLIVSHDREFLDQTVTRVLYLDPEMHAVTSYTGNYSDFVDSREHERELHAESWKKQQEYVERVESDIARLKGQALGVELSTTPAQPTIRRYAKKVAKKAKSRERKLDRYLESDERVEKPKSRWNLKLDFGPPPAGGRAVLRLEEVAFSYDRSPDDEGRTTNDEGFTLSSFVVRPSSPLLQDVSFEVAYKERLALVGPNGA
ncbi:MAG: ATP-binding cassette domain-containing protein, partial [Roseiflexaceae bacterium]